MTELRDLPEAWPVHDTETLETRSGPFSVRRDVLSHPDSPEERFGRLVVDHPGAVVVLAVDDWERAFVLRQYRHPAQARLVELPAGLLDEPGEEPEQAARRELREEALLVARRWTHLLTTYSSPGFSSETIAYYVAEELSAAPDRGGFEPAHEESDMDSGWAPMSELLAGVLAGRLRDGPLAQAVMAHALLRGRTRLDPEPGPRPPGIHSPEPSPGDGDAQAKEGDPRR